METLSNHSIQPIEGQRALHKGSSPKAHSLASPEYRRCCPCEEFREEFRPRYKDYRVTKRLGNARVEVCDNHGKLSVRHISDVK